MSIAISRKTIRCPNCNYTGKSKVKGTGGTMGLLGLVSIIIGLFFWPMFIVAGLMFLVAIFMPAKQICPQCKFENVVPVVPGKETA